MRVLLLSFLTTTFLFGWSPFPGHAQQQTGHAQQSLDSVMPVRGFCIDLPRSAGLDSFVHFINEELAPRKVNTLFLLVDYHYQFKSHPELTDSFALSNAEVKKIVKACARHNIRIIPQINLLGHQGWEERPGKLLQAYPEFDETPWVKNPDKYVWPNADNLYCRSYCPLHPKIHEVLFAVIDELCDAFECNAFHGGMDEVFYLGESKCPRCGGQDPSVLFAGEVRTIHDHLAQKGRELWIWGDRLIDGKTTGIGEWEASYNNSYRAIDLIPKDVVICDWHYERPDKTAVYFAMKGFSVVTCPWRVSGPGIAQVDDMVRFRDGSTPEMKARFLGIVETTWSPTQSFLNGFYGVGQKGPAREHTAWQCFKDVFQKIDTLGN
ncbi:MAG TPA: family 20 glycosylhydrolase [Puia sp.]